MNDVSEEELAALRDGGDRGGAYLESIDKTDLATLSGEEWDTFLGHVMCGYSESMRNRAGDTPPF